MSFFSSLMLVATQFKVVPKVEEINQLLEELNLINPAQRESLCNLAADITALFEDPEARRDNPNFFCPDGIRCETEILVSGWEEWVKCSGFGIEISGNGYIWPWDMKKLRECVERSAKLVRLQQEMNARWPASFLLPSTKSELQSRVLTREAGWAWVISETG